MFLMSRVSHAVSSCVLEEVKNLVLSQRRLSEQGVHVKEEQCQDHAPEKLEKPRRSLKPAHGERRRPSWARGARTRREGRVPGDACARASAGGLVLRTESLQLILSFWSLTKNPSLSGDIP